MKLVNMIFVILGCLFLGLGVIGTILPVLPTTPFLLLAAFFFAKGSEKFHQWFCKTKLYQVYVEPAVNQKVMEKSSKRKAMCVLGIIFTISFFLVPVWQAKVVILLVALFHAYYFLFKIKTLNKGSSVQTTQGDSVYE